jgi:RNA polymerase sigma-70 factor, ECF subfamily
MASMDSYETWSDTELLKAALAGEEDAFVLLYQRLKTGIFRYAFYMTNSISSAEEVTQDVFITLLKEGRNYRDGRGDVGAFAFGIARNLVRRVRRQERTHQPLPDDDGIHQLAASLVTEPEALQRKLIRSEALQRVRAMIGSLPDRYAQVIVLCDLCELSYVEAASRLDCAVGTVRSRLNRAHALLAKKLKPFKSAKAGIQATGTEGCVI